MAWTRWLQPQTVERLENNQIDFSDGDAELDRVTALVSVLPVYGVGTSASDTAVNVYGSNSLLFRDFEFAGGPVVGIEVETNIVRLNRVRDRVVQLWSNGIIGTNRAGNNYDQKQKYGGASDLWGVPSLNNIDSNFGVVIDLQPHPQYPSSTTVIIRSVSVRFWVD
jgi:hypothetical protein